MESRPDEMKSHLVLASKEEGRELFDHVEMQFHEMVNDKILFSFWLVNVCLSWNKS